MGIINKFISVPGKGATNIAKLSAITPQIAGTEPRVQDGQVEYAKGRPTRYLPEMLLVGQPEIEIIRSRTKARRNASPGSSANGSMTATNLLQQKKEAIGPTASSVGIQSVYPAIQTNAGSAQERALYNPSDQPSQSASDYFHGLVNVDPLGGIASIYHESDPTLNTNETQSPTVLSHIANQIRDSFQGT